MPMTVNHDQTVVERIRRDPEFARALFDKALRLKEEGEPEAAQVILRNLKKGGLRPT